MPWWKRTLRWAIHLAAMIAVLSTTPRLPAQLALSDSQLSGTVELDLANNAARSNLERVRQFLADAQWDEAIEIIRSVMENESDKLIRISPDLDDTDSFQHYVTIRELCQMKLAQLAETSSEALQLYRNRVDPLAGRWYQQAFDERDPHRLQRIVDQMFVSSYGDDALLLLGEFALERGDYRKARHCWERINPALRARAVNHPLLQNATGLPLWLALRGLDLDSQWDELEGVFTSTTVPQTWLAYPDTDLRMADVRARLVLVSILEGSPARARWELDVLRRLHGAEEGQLAGRSGNYVELLDALLQQSQQWPEAHVTSDWQTLGRSAVRNGRSVAGVDISGQPIWTRPLPRLSAANEQAGFGRLRVSEDPQGLLGYHPLILGDLVLVGEPSNIKAFHLHTGRPYFGGRAASPAGPQFSQQQADDAGAIYRFEAAPLGEREFVGVPRYTLTAHNGALFAKMGSPITGTNHPDEILSQQRGHLIGLDLRTQGKMLPGFPVGVAEPHWAFEGPPVSDGTRIYVGMRYRDDVGAEAHVACYDIQTGERRWRRFVCAAESLAQGRVDEITHNLLTLRHGRLYYNTNLGVIAALAAEDGAVLWITRYPRHSYPARDPYRMNQHHFRDRNPCLLYKDLVIAAPSDCDRLFALDASTGQLIWVSLPEKAADAVHLLGVGGENLLASGDYLYWFQVYSGLLVGQFPDPRGTAPGSGRALPRGLGRGVLAGQHVYWPTREHIYVFQQHTLRTPNGWEPVLVRAPIELTQRGATGGNLTMAHGVLLIATADRLYAFNQTGHVSPDAPLQRPLLDGVPPPDTQP